MYQAWLHYGEFLVLGIWGILLTLVRRVLIGKICKDAALVGGEKGKMLKQMTLKFEKSYEVNVGIHDMSVFVKKYLCQEKKLGIYLERWRTLPERWTSLIVAIGFVETMVLKYLNYGTVFCLNRFLAALTAAVLVKIAVLWFETDSLWTQAQVSLLDYVANTLYPRKIHVYEGFEDEVKEIKTEKEREQEKETKNLVSSSEFEDENINKKEPEKEILLKKEEEQIFQEVLSDFLGSST